MTLPPWLPDIGVLGPWTYLATELAFGSVAFALLYRAGALRRAGKTILALYPIAFLWDWYTLQVGVFSIELRTGWNLLGIPVEEHLFMVVVPALVVGIHETIHGHAANDAAPERADRAADAAVEPPDSTPGEAGSDPGDPPEGHADAADR